MDRQDHCDHVDNVLCIKDETPIGNEHLSQASQAQHMRAALHPDARSLTLRNKTSAHWRNEQYISAAIQADSTQHIIDARGKWPSYLKQLEARADTTGKQTNSR